MCCVNQQPSEICAKISSPTPLVLQDYGEGGYHDETRFPCQPKWWLVKGCYFSSSLLEIALSSSEQWTLSSVLSGAWQCQPSANFSCWDLINLALNELDAVQLSNVTQFQIHWATEYPCDFKELMQLLTYPIYSQKL